MKENFQRKQTVNDFRNNCNTEGYDLYNKNSIFVSHIYTFPLAGKIFVYTLIQDTNREKYFNHTISKEKLPILAGNKHLSVPFILDKPRLFRLLA